MPRVLLGVGIIILPSNPQSCILIYSNSLFQVSKPRCWRCPFKVRANRPCLASGSRRSNENFSNIVFFRCLESRRALGVQGSRTLNPTTVNTDPKAAQHVGSPHSIHSTRESEASPPANRAINPKGRSHLHFVSGLWV